jgi:hypothetical protein
MNSITAIVRRKSQLNEMIRAAIALKDDYQILFVIDDATADLAAEMQNICNSAGFSAIEIPCFQAGPSRRVDWAMTATRKLSVRLRPTAREWVRLATHCFSDEHRNLRAGKVCLSMTAASLLMVPEDGLGGNGAMIAAARKARIPVLVVPYEFSTKEQAIQGATSRQDHYLDRAFFRMFPRWPMHYKGKTITRLPNQIALARELLGTAPEKPWLVHGGQADRIAVESDFMLRHYLEDGICRSKLAPVGSLANDEMFRVMCRDPALLSAFNSGSRIGGPTRILSALPPDYTATNSKNFSNYRDLVNFWTATLSSLPNTAVTYQLHPSISMNDASHIRGLVQVSNENIATLIPKADVLVTTVSSIVRLAISCRKPTVNFDAYNFNYPDYRNIAGVFEASTPDEFTALVNRTGDDIWFAETTKQMRPQSDFYGRMDGQSSRRLRELVKELISKK